MCDSNPPLGAFSDFTVFLKFFFKLNTKKTHNENRSLLLCLPVFTLTALLHDSLCLLQQSTGYIFYFFFFKPDTVCVSRKTLDPCNTRQDVPVLLQPEESRAEGPHVCSWTTGTIVPGYLWLFILHICPQVEDENNIEHEQKQQLLFYAEVNVNKALQITMALKERFDFWGNMFIHLLAQR